MEVNMEKEPITVEGLKNLKSELENLKNVQRPKVVEAIAEARSHGDLKENKNFFNRDLEKNIYLNNKNHLINLNILNFVSNSKYKLRDFLETLKKILKSKCYIFPIDGLYLMKNGMKEGAAIGRVLKIIENEWINNGFKISKDRVKEIIKLN